MRRMSQTISTGRRRRRSTHTPAMRPSSGNARKAKASSRPTCTGVAARMRIATVGRASVLTWLPDSLMNWPHQSSRNSPSRHSLVWNTSSYDAAPRNPTIGAGLARLGRAMTPQRIDAAMRGRAGGVLRKGGLTPLRLDLGCELCVLLFADQVVQLAAVIDAHLDEPSRSVWLGVDEVRVVQHLRVD